MADFKDFEVGINKLYTITKTYSVLSLEIVQVQSNLKPYSRFHLSIVSETLSTKHVLKNILYL